MKKPRIPGITPTPFGPERAVEIWSNRGPEWELEGRLTDGEDLYVRQVWDTMMGDKSWMDAFLRIMHGRLLQKS